MHHVAMIASLLAVLAAGCQPSDAQVPPSRTPAPPKAKPLPQPAPRPARPQTMPVIPPRDLPPPRVDYDAMRFHMHQNFDLLRAIERLLIRGKLEDARRFAEAIAAAPEPPAHGPWAAHTVLVRERAAALARSTKIDEACDREAKLAAACAGCHVELGVATEFRTHPPVPPDQPTVEARMLRHRWAADRMWEGMIGGADEPWRAGLEVLAAPPLAWSAFAPGRAAYAKQLRVLAENARRNPRLELEGRATAYGEMLATCAACHTAPAKRP